MNTKGRRWTTAYLLVGLIVAYLVVTVLRSPDPWVGSAVFGFGIGGGVLLSAMLESIRGYAARRGDAVLRRVDQIIGVVVGLLVAIPLLDAFLEFVPTNGLRVSLGTALGFFLAQNMPKHDLEQNDLGSAQPENAAGVAPLD